MSLNFANLFADWNGTAFAQAGTGEWGFISDTYKIAIPAGNAYPQNYTLGTSPFADDVARETFIKANFAKLVAGGVPQNSAIQIAVFRMHIANQGLIALLFTNRHVVEDEYEVIQPQNANWADVANDIPANVYTPDIAKHYKRYGNAYVHMMVYVFLARGHHYKTEYNELYDRLKSACFIPSNPGFALLNNEELFRLALHGFGVRPLVDLALEDKRTGRMAAAMYIRYTPATPISGVAHITTLKATLDQMASEPWYASFENKFEDEITEIEHEVEAIHTNPLQYHVSSRILGAGARIMPSAAAEAAFKRLCQFALGYIDHLGRKHSLAGQQAVTKKSGGMTGLADAFAKACDRFGKPSVDVSNMTEFFAQI